MPSTRPQGDVDLIDILCSLSATRYAAHRISGFLRAMHLRFGSRAWGCSCIAFVLLATGCWSSYWGRRSLDQPTPVDSDDPVFIWSSRGVEKWHAVVITQDSVSGIPYETSLKCAICRRSIPKVQVDSMRLYYRTLAENATDVVGTATLIILGELAVGLVVNALR